MQPNPGNLRATAETVRQSAVRRRGPAVRAMLCLAVPLLIGLLTGHPAEGAQASFGGLAGLYVPDSPYRYQVRVVAAVGPPSPSRSSSARSPGQSDGWPPSPPGCSPEPARSSVRQWNSPRRPARSCSSWRCWPPPQFPPTPPKHSCGGSHRRRRRAGVADRHVARIVEWDRPETTTIAAALAGVADLADLADRIGSGNEPAARHTAVNSVRRARLAMEQAGRTEPHRLTRIVESTEGLLEAALRSTVEETSPRHPALAFAIRAQIPLIAAHPDFKNGTDRPTKPRPTDPLAGVEDLHTAVIGGPTDLTNEHDAARSPSQPGLVARLRAAAGQHSASLFPPPPVSVSPSPPGSASARRSASPTLSGSD